MSSRKVTPEEFAEAFCALSGIDLRSLGEWACQAIIPLKPGEKVDWSKVIEPAPKGKQ